MTLTSNSERYLIAFTTIEADMNRRIKSDHFVSYSELIRKMATLDRAYHKFLRYLEEFGDLRNAIVHERIDGEVIAEPHLKIVEEIEHIAQVLTQPERVKDHFLKQVDFLFEDELLEAALITLEKTNYSKIPVYDRTNRFSGLLTTDAITRYLVKNIKTTNCVIPKVMIKAILLDDPKDRNVSFVAETTSLIGIIAEFDRALALGKRLQEIIITQDGALNQKPLGIITIADLPIIYEKINRFLIP